MRIRPPCRISSLSIRAVIFDVDGVLVNSMERNHEAYQKVFRSLGIRIPKREVFANEGRRSRELIAFLAQKRGLSLSGPQLEAMTREHRDTFASFGPMPLYPGVVGLVRTLRRRGLQLAMVTSNWRSAVEQHFTTLTNLFDVVVTAEDVTRTKPDPEPYLLALDRLHLSGDQAVVVENAPLGIQSARAAGLRVIAVTSTNPKRQLAGADIIVTRVAEVARTLQVLH